ncbi:hypothetical protein J1N35_005159 [Gossypium stocksii]|uniref:DUF4283 domain-containing protein n=1 Tax=Gossypium stocksii TaxID=47602 RepID=A0A9D4AIC8_9ROSI|nr:hypothetical protein J1N35_005159 [Gossypium stocksii]
MSETLPTVEFVVGANHTVLNSGVGRAMKKYIGSWMCHRTQMTKQSMKMGGLASMYCSTRFRCCGAPSPLQLMDLENDYYLVRFHDEVDYNKVLMGDPWVIFGQYLTVRLWSPAFSTSENEVDIQVVWIRLLGLPGSYYSDFLL